MLKLGIISIATNIYLDYWKEQAVSVDLNADESLDVTLHIFTDQPEKAAEFGKSLKNIGVVAHPIEPYGWPEATLYRYKIISDHASQLPEDVLMYLDSDMLVKARVSERDFANNGHTGLTLVRHPGFQRPSGARALSLYISKPKVAISDFYLRYSMGALGAWETDPRSMAQVPRAKRTHYVCGGTWWGHRDDLLRLAEDLAARVAGDEANGVMAKWHDESHLNWWAANHIHHLRDSSYCYSSSYVWLRHLPQIIQAVDKQAATR